MSISLPARYEDLDQTFKGKLAPNQKLINELDRLYKSMVITKGIRFLPIYGESGAGKSCASIELSTHMPEVATFLLSKGEVEDKGLLLARVNLERSKTTKRLLVAVVDQYEEVVDGSEKIPTQFVERLSILDRNELKDELVVFVWLTTSREFQSQLVKATNRSKRLLGNSNFEIKGPEKSDWAAIVDETFSFHNNGSSLADYGVIEQDIINMSREADTLGEIILLVGEHLSSELSSLENLSNYQVIILWPVADSTRSQRVAQFTKARPGYKLNWDAWYAELNSDDLKNLPLNEYNRTRLYFDFRLVPVRAADMHQLCLELDRQNKNLPKANLDRFSNTHFYHVVSDKWDSYSFSPMRERESDRSDKAKVWYESITKSPTKVGKRLAEILNELGLDAAYEKTIKTEYSQVRADVFVAGNNGDCKDKIIELKLYSSENTMPSSIKDQIKITMRRHAQLAGFIQKQ